MDTRILFDYIQRSPWVFGLATIFTFTTGFLSNGKATSVLVSPLIWLLIFPVTTELQKQGPVWLQQTLPVKKLLLAQTIWVLLVVLPVATIATSLLPAYTYGLITGSDNLASTNLFQFIAKGFLITSVFYMFLALSHLWWKYTLLRIVALAIFLAMGWGVTTVFLSGKLWDTVPTRLGLIAISALLVFVSYRMAPQILRVTGRNPWSRPTKKPGTNQANSVSSLRDDVLASPVGRALVAGLWLVIVVTGLNLFESLQSEHFEVLNSMTKTPSLIAILVVSHILLWSISAVHITSLRAMKSLPISRFRQSLTFISLPMVALFPLLLSMALVVIFTTTNSAEILRIVLVILYSLMAVQIGLALYLRFGKTVGIIGLVIMMQVLATRLFISENSLLQLSALDIPVSIVMILLAGIWTHRILDRNSNPYRQHLVPTGTQYS